LSRRAAVLAGLLLVVGIALAPFLKDAVNQQAELAALERDVVQREQRVDELEQQLDRWDDPAFVKAQARQRLKYVMPGEVGYIVLDERPEEEPVGPSSQAAGDVEGHAGPWFGSLWQSVQQAGQEPVDLTKPADPAQDPGDPKPAPSP
jgi:cell division protein FtsB